MQYHTLTYADIQFYTTTCNGVHNIPWHTTTHTHTHIHSHTDIQQHTTYNDIQWHTLTYTDIQRHTPTSNGMPWHIYNDISYVRMICKQSHNGAASNTLCKGFVWMLMFFFCAEAKTSRTKALWKRRESAFKISSRESRHEDNIFIRIIC